MSFDLHALKDAVKRHGKVARLVIARVDGSAPREAGASMLVWDGGQSGTIGGGTLEFDAAKTALDAEYVHRIPLGPALGQCCGGAVTLVCEHFEARDLDGVTDYALRQVERGHDMPLSITRALSQHRSGTEPLALQFADGWLLEPVTKPARHLWIYGAGHVGRALVAVLAPLPDVDVTWVDTAANRFPTDELPANVAPLVAANPADVVKHAPADAEHLVLTYSHAFDLEICHQLLAHGFASAGLIGSATKWARFQKRLVALGHSDAQISRIVCPIGDPAFGKHPQAIAVSVGAAFMSREQGRIHNLGKTA